MTNTEKPCEAVGNEHCWKHDRAGKECHAPVDAEVMEAVEWGENLLKTWQDGNCYMSDRAKLKTLIRAAQSQNKNGEKE